MKVKGHNHVTGKYRASAHQACNLNISLSKRFPFVFYSLQSYDSHPIFQEIGKYSFKINIMPKPTGKYTSLTIQQPKEKSNEASLPLVMIDSDNFLND